jgi:type VI secretion system protein VasJ
VTSGTGVGEIKAAALPVVHAIRQADPMNPTSYRVLRCLKWDDAPGAPPADPTSGKTRVPAPRAQARTAIEGLLSSGNWAGLLEAAEGAFAEPSGTWWLDLQRYTVVAIENLDSTRGPKAAEFVKGEIARFLERVGNISGLLFGDGSPMASEATKQWLAEIESGGGGGGGGFVMMSSSAGGGVGDVKVFDPAELEEAKTHFAKKRLAQALDILQRGIERAQGSRAKFRARLIAGRTCLEAEQEDWARTLLEESLRDMETFTFERWEQELAVETYQLLANALARVAKERKDLRDSLRVEIDKIKSKLFRLDMRAAAMVDDLMRK